VPSGFDSEAQMLQQLNVSPRPEDLRVTAVEERSTETTAQLPAESIRLSLRRKKRNPRYDQHDYAGLTYKKAWKGPDRIAWEKAACEEFHRLIVETVTMKIIKFEEMEDGRKPSYYNPQTRIKVKSDGSKEFRVRETYGGNISVTGMPQESQR
jgi:hypothetical protein